MDGGAPWTRLLTGALALVGLALLGLSVRAAAAAGRADGLVIHALGVAAYPLLALVIAVWAGRRRGALALGLAFAAIGLNGGVLFYPPLRSPPWGWILPAASFAFGAAAFLRGTQRFPRPLTPADVARFGTPAPPGRALRRVLAALLGPVAIWVGCGGALLILLLLARNPLYGVPQLAVVGTGLLYLRVGYTSGSEAERRQLYWFLQAVVARLGFEVLGLSLVTFGSVADVALPLPAISRWLSLAGTLAVAGCCAVGIFFAGALDPRLAIRRTFLVASAPALFIFGVAVVEQLVTAELALRLGLDATFTAAVAGAAMGMLFRPVQDRVSRWVGRLLGLG